MSSPCFVEAFCGPGGSSLGLVRAGLQPKLAFDTDAVAVATHAANLNGACVVADATALSGARILEQAGLQAGELDLLSGGPPCQGFSKQKRGAHLGDDRNGLVLEFARLAGELQPRALLFENVAIFGQSRGRRHLREMQERLGGYQLHPHVYNSADYGLAQTRQRFVLVGLRRDQGGTFEVPAPSVTRWRTVGEVLAGLPEPPVDGSVHPDYPNHQRSVLAPRTTERFSFVPQGGGWRDIPEHLQLPCHRATGGRQGGGWPDVYGRLQWDGQCPTITGGFDSFTRGRYGHPHADRPLTAREAARLQGFPDDFQFLGARRDWRRQIGNVMPPPLAEVLGRAILAALDAS